MELRQEHRRGAESKKRIAAVHERDSQYDKHDTSTYIRYVSSPAVSHLTTSMTRCRPLTAVHDPEGEDDAADAKNDASGNGRDLGPNSVKEDTAWQSRNLWDKFLAHDTPLSAARTLVVLLATVNSRFSRVSCFLHGAASSVQRSA